METTIIDFGPLLTEAWGLFAALVIGIVGKLGWGAWFEAKTHGIIQEEKFNGWLSELVDDGIGFADEAMRKHGIPRAKIEGRGQMARIAAMFVKTHGPDTVKFMRKKYGMDDKAIVDLVLARMWTPEEDAEDPVPLTLPVVSSIDVSVEAKVGLKRLEG